MASEKHKCASVCVEKPTSEGFHKGRCIVMKRFIQFSQSEDGAVTVDWVVLTAAIVGLGIAVVTSVRNGVTSLATGVETSLTTATVANVGQLGFAGPVATATPTCTDPDQSSGVQRGC
jgi:Flp pilus assembly pilin Flp